MTSLFRMPVLTMSVPTADRAGSNGLWICCWTSIVASPADGRCGRFFDRHDISNFADWESEIFHKGLTRSRLFLAFLSPAYFARSQMVPEPTATMKSHSAARIVTSSPRDSVASKIALPY